MKKILFLFIVLVFSIDVSFAQDAREIISKMEQQMRGESSFAEITMTIVRPRYTREMTMKNWAKGDDYALILVTAPAREKGTAFLKREKEIWNWVPTVDRMIKLPPSMMSQSWMGSDFSNDDLIRESSTVEDYTHKILRSEKVGNSDTWVIELTPKPDAAVVWGKVLMWVDKSNYLQLKAEQYDERNELVNSVISSDVQKMGGREIPTKIELIPADKPGHKTVIEYKQADFNPGIKDEFFSIQNLKQVR